MLRLNKSKKINRKSNLSKAKSQKNKTQYGGYVDCITTKTEESIIIKILSDPKYYENLYMFNDSYYEYNTYNNKQEKLQKYEEALNIYPLLDTEIGNIEIPCSEEISQKPKSKTIKELYYGSDKKTEQNKSPLLKKIRDFVSPLRDYTIIYKNQGLAAKDYIEILLYKAKKIGQENKLLQPTEAPELTELEQSLLVPREDQDSSEYLGMKLPEGVFRSQPQLVFKKSVKQHHEPVNRYKEPSNISKMSKMNPVSRRIRSRIRSTKTSDKFSNSGLGTGTESGNENSGNGNENSRPKRKSSGPKSKSSGPKRKSSGRGSRNSNNMFRINNVNSINI